MHYKTYKSILLPDNRMNIYRGCLHGCIYCDSRSRCYQFDHEFEDIEVKANAPAMLEAALRRKREPCMIGTGSMTDSYTPPEDTLFYTRRCLEVIERYGCGVSLLTKSDLVLRDLDLLERINRQAKCVVQMTLTTYDEHLCRLIEPRAATTYARYKALCALRDRGIATVVWLSPILPFINDTEENILGILQYCADAGVGGIVCFGMGLTLREGNREHYYAQLDRHFPGVRARFHETYGARYENESPNSPHLMRLFQDFCRSHNIETDHHVIFSDMTRLDDRQLRLGDFTD